MDRDLVEGLLDHEACGGDLVIAKEKDGVADGASANAGKARGRLMGHLALLHRRLRTNDLAVLRVKPRVF
jgi:hypothetical protein